MPLNIADIYAHTPGSRFLISCPSMLQGACSTASIPSMPSVFNARTALNSIPIASMDIVPDENPNHFSDLFELCAKLVSAASKRSHLEGLLIINISSLLPASDNITKLKALGELLSMKDGPSQCETIYQSGRIIDTRHSNPE